jgi:hypothetical protein
VSVVLAVAIAATIARPARFFEAARETGTTQPARAVATGSVKKENALLTARLLATYAPPSRMAPVPVRTSRVRPAPVETRKNDRVSRTARAVAPVRQPVVTRRPTRPAPTVTRPAATQEYVGSLVVMSEPSGAAVRVDGQTVGTTPLRLDRVRVGSHAVHVVLDGYPVWSTAATVVYGKSNDVVARLGR